MKSPRQQRNEARRARHRALRDATSFKASQATEKRRQEATDAARLARFEIQGRGFRPIFPRTPLAEPIAQQTFQSTALGGGDVNSDNRQSMMGHERKTAGRQLGGGV